MTRATREEWTSREKMSNEPLPVTFVYNDERVIYEAGAYYSGSAMGPPHVAGVMALMREANPELTPPQMMQILYDTAHDLGDPGKDNSYGYGMVDAYEAVQAALDLLDCPGDLDGDGDTDQADLGQLLASYGVDDGGVDGSGVQSDILTVITGGQGDSGVAGSHIPHIACVDIQIGGFPFIQCAAAVIVAADGVEGH